MSNISVSDTSSHRELVREDEWVSQPRVLTEAEATKLLDRIAPDWPLHLYDGMVIDHILKVVNQARTSRTEVTRRYRARRAAYLAEDEAKRNATQCAIQSHGSDSAATTEKAGECLQDRPLARKAHTEDHETRRRFLGAGLGRHV